jgi:hypothetical protein
MAFKEKDMYDAAWDAVRRRYPLSDGWELTAQDNHGTYIPDFVLRRTFRREVWYVPVEVKDECVATQSHVNQLNRYARNLAGGNARIENKILVYPVGADVSVVPEDIEVIKLRGFVCE